MGSNKAFLLLGLSLAIVLLISSEVAARELAEAQTTTTNKNTEAATVDGRGGYNGYNGGGGYHNGGGGYHNSAGGYYNGGGLGGGHGPLQPQRDFVPPCCNYATMQVRCCSYAGEVVDAKTTEVKSHN